MTSDVESTALGRRRFVATAGTVAAGAAGLALAGAVNPPSARAATFSYTPVTPYRSIDTRDFPFPPIQSGDWVRWPVWINKYAEDPLENPQIPKSAAAVTFNLTATSTQVRGWLAIQPSTLVDPVFLGISTLNWAATGISIANAGTVGLAPGYYDPDVIEGSVDILCGGAGATHFLIDITGYYA